MLMDDGFPRCVIAIGRNYADHAKEMGREVAEELVVFMENPAAVIQTGEPIIIPPICDEPHEQVDYEGELAVLIGRNARDVSEDDALSYVEGYAAANDVTARWWQRHGSGGQYVRGKSFDTFLPLSDITPRESVPDPQALRIVTKLNGDVVQDALTSTMLFSVAQIISELSRGITLLKGTVLLTGSPAGVGAGRTPPRFLQSGDVVEVSIDGVGVVKNTIQHA